jgi:ubiquinone/menaquinone biosynthesis C-methylase UbiE/uncharacterized protein YbaR (Trm112 family)
MGKHTDFTRTQAYHQFYSAKYDWVNLEIARLTQIKQRIEQKLEPSNIKMATYETRGVPLRAIEYLKCPKCRQALKMLDGKLENHHVISGELSCTCGQGFQIVNGILMDSQNENMTHDTEVIDEASHFLKYLMNYLQDTDYGYIKNIVSGMDWLRKQKTFSYDIALELGTGSGFFLRYFLDILPERGLYFAVDYDYKRLMALKTVLQEIPNGPSIVFVCCDFANIPLGEEMVDCLIDYAGSSNYAFDHPSFLLERMLPLLKKEANWVGSYILFENFKKESLVSPEHQYLFKEREVTALLHRFGFSISDKFITDVVAKGGPGENYFVSGEKVYGMSAFGTYHKN